MGIEEQYVYYFLDGCGNRGGVCLLYFTVLWDWRRSMFTIFYSAVGIEEESVYSILQCCGNREGVCLLYFTVLWE